MGTLKEEENWLSVGEKGAEKWKGSV